MNGPNDLMELELFKHHSDTADEYDEIDADEIEEPEPEIETTPVRLDPATVTETEEYADRLSYEIRRNVSTDEAIRQAIRRAKGYKWEMQSIKRAAKRSEIEGTTHGTIVIGDRTDPQAGRIVLGYRDAYRLGKNLIETAQAVEKRMEAENE